MRLDPMGVHAFRRTCRALHVLLGADAVPDLMNDVQSEPIESLRIVSDKEFSFVHYALQNRIPRKERLAKKENGDYSESRWKASEHSAKLLCGLLYCRACGGKMVGAYNMKKTAY